jgi:hypothetical protein
MAPSTHQAAPIARRVLSREIVKVPRAIVRRTGMQVARGQYALRPSRSPEETVRRALMPGADLSSFRAGDGRRFFFKRDDTDGIIGALERSVPGWRARTLADADRICAHDLRLLGADSVQLGAAIPWHRDVLNGYDWRPRTFYRQVPVPYDRADMKVPWEMARCQHLVTLGMAFRASGEERYAREVVAQIDDFIAQNRPGYGINWVSTMDVAIRATSWLWAHELIAGAEVVSDEFVTNLVASLIAHARHIEENISVYEGGVTTNHTVADYAGLAYLGLMLPELRSSRRWADAGIDGLAECMRRHTSSDGVDYENSLAYHRLVTEMYLGALVLAERNGRSFPIAFRDSLERMVEFVIHYGRPDGLAPLVGDSDDGRWHVLADYSGWEPRDHRHLLGPAAAIFGRADFAAATAGSSAAAEEAAWLVGPKAAGALAADPHEPIALTSRAFAAGGRYVMRHVDHYALVSADEVGTGGFGNHKHNDILGYELAVGGRPAIVDCGSYIYLRDRAARTAFRSTRAHNTLMVEGLEQNAMTDAFRMRPDSRVQVHEWRTGRRADILDVSHSGYESCPAPVRHRRRLGMMKEPFAWLVVDSLEGSGEHHVESSIHLASDLSVADGGGAARGREAEIAGAIAALAMEMGFEPALTPYLDAALAADRDGRGVLVVPINWSDVSVESGWIAPRYGRRLSAPVIRMRGRVGVQEPVGYVVLPA